MSSTTINTPQVLPKKSYRSLSKFVRNKGAVIGALIILACVLAAIFAPHISPYDPNAADFLAVRKPPSPAHWLGTDEIGRDILTRIIFGARASLLAGVLSVAIAVLLGVPLGLLSGYFGGWIDAVISRFTEALLALPFLIMAIALASFLGPSLENAMIAIGISAMPLFIRITRGQVLSVKAEEYVEGARAIGLNDFRIMVRYIFPNTLPAIVVQATITIATAIIAEASLSFLGLGQQPPSPSWGSMLSKGKDFMVDASWMWLAPGRMIFLVVLAFNMMGDGLRDALAPRD